MHHDNVDRQRLYNSNLYRINISKNNVSMSFIRKGKSFEKKVFNEQRTEVFKATPKHPMLKWRSGTATKKIDHLDNYVKVDPYSPNFLPTEGKYPMTWQQFKSANAGKSKAKVSALWAKYKASYDKESSGFSKPPSSKTPSAPSASWSSSSYLPTKIGLSIGDKVVITRNGKYNGVEGKLVSKTPTGFQVDIGAAKTIVVASRSLKKKAGWAWGSSKQEAVTSFSAMGAANASFWWCLESKSHAAACALGAGAAVAVGGAAFTAAMAYATAALAGVAWYAAVVGWYGTVGLSALSLGYGVLLAKRELMLEQYDKEEKFAGLSTKELELRIEELKANQCWAVDLRTSCYTSADLLKSAQEVLDWQKKICENGDCKKLLKLFSDIDGAKLTQEEQEERIQKRKDLFFGHIWSQYKNIDDDKIKELEEDDLEGLQNLCDDFNRQNRNIFQHREDWNNELTTASVSGSSYYISGGGILAGLTNTKEILKALADKQKEMIDLHNIAVAAWVQTYNAFASHMRIIDAKGLASKLPPSYYRQAKILLATHRPSSTLLEDGDKDDQMEAKLSVVRGELDQKVETLQYMLDAVDVNNGSVVESIREESSERNCLAKNTAKMFVILRGGGVTVDILRAQEILETPSEELMKKICKKNWERYQEKPGKLAKWIIARNKTEL